MKPVVVQYNSSYLPLTEVWIYNQLRQLTGFRIIFLCRKLLNRAQFPLDEVHSLSELSPIIKILHLLFFKAVGYIPFFSNHARQAHILHVHFGYNAAKLIGLKRHLNIPMICSLYGVDAYSYSEQKRINRIRLRRLFHHADKILVLGPYMRDHLIKLGCDQSKITIHHLGVKTGDIIYKKREYKSARPIRFLLTSSFVEKKGVDICLKALSGLKNEIDFTVDIIGDGPLKQEILDILARGDLRSRVTLHGYKPYKFFINLAYECDIFLQASKTSKLNDKEGTPMSLVDAMATGMPVIATEHSDIPEIVQHGSTGFLAKENSVSHFKEAILEMTNRISDISEFSENGRKWIEDQFDAEKQSVVLSSIYNDLMKSS